MKRQALAVAQQTSAWLLTLAVVATGCGKGNTTLGAPLPVPTLNAAPPIYTHNPNLALTGTRPEQTDVVAVLGNGNEVILAKASGSSTKWSGALPLRVGQNNFQLYAQRSTGTSPRTSVYSTMLVALQTPTLNNVLVNGVTYFYMGDNPPASIQGNLNGTKSPDGNLELTYSGVTTQAAGVDNNAAWNANVTVTHGPADAMIISKDTAGDVSGSLSFKVTGTWQPGPHIDPTSYTADTNRVQQHLYGTKPANTRLWFILNNGTPIQVTADSNTIAVGATTWDYTFALAEGDNVAAVYVYGLQDTYPSAPDVARIRLSTKVSAPVFVPPLPNPLPPTTNPILSLGGTVGPNSYVCVSRTPWNGDPAQLPPCDATSNTQGPNGGTFSVDIPLQPGNNPLYFTARDPAGNASGQIVTSIYLISAPTVTNVNVTQADPNGFGVTFNAGPDPGDVSVPQAAIASVQVCVPDSTHCSNLPLDANGNYTFADPNAFKTTQNGGSYQVTITVTDQAGGTHVYTAVNQYSTGAPVWLSRDANGTSFSPTNYTAPHDADLSRVAVDMQGNAYMVWQDRCAELGTTGCRVPLGANQSSPDIFLVKRTASVGFGAVTLVSGNLTGTNDDGISLTPAIAIDSAGTVHVVWADNGGLCNPSGGQVQCILHRTLSSSGVLSATDTVGTPSSVNDSNPSISADASTNIVHVTYTHAAGGGNPNQTIVYRQLTGSGWSAALTMGTLTGYGANPAASAVVALPNGVAQVAWQDCLSKDTAHSNFNWCTSTPQNYDIILQQVPNPPAAGTPVLFSNNVKPADSSTRGPDGDSRSAALAYDPTANNGAGAAVLVWSDTGTLGSNAGLRRNIYYRYTSDAGSAYNLLSNDPNINEASQPTIASNNGRTVVFWFGTPAAGGGKGSIYGKQLATSPQPQLIHSAANGNVGDTAPSVGLDSSGKLTATWTSDMNPDPTIPNTTNPSTQALNNMTYYQGLDATTLPQ